MTQLVVSMKMPNTRRNHGGMTVTSLADSVLCDSRQEIHVAAALMTATTIAAIQIGLPSNSSEWRLNMSTQIKADATPPMPATMRSAITLTRLDLSLTGCR